MFTAPFRMVWGGWSSGSLSHHIPAHRCELTISIHQYQHHPHHSPINVVYKIPTICHYLPIDRGFSHAIPIDMIKNINPKILDC